MNVISVGQQGNTCQIGSSVYFLSFTYIANVIFLVSYCLQKVSSKPQYFNLHPLAERFALQLTWEFISFTFTTTHIFRIFYFKHYVWTAHSRKNTCSPVEFEPAFSVWSGYLSNTVSNKNNNNKYIGLKINSLIFLKFLCLLSRKSERWIVHSLNEQKGTPKKQCSK